MSPPAVGSAFAASGALAAAIAAALEETARDLAVDVEGVEHAAASLPPTPGVARDVRELRHRAEMVGIAYAYFKEMAERPETPVDIDDFALRPIGPWSPVTKP